MDSPTSQSLGSPSDPVFTFLEAASVPRAAHASGTLDEAEDLLVRHPQIATSNIYVAAALADETVVSGFLSRDPSSASARGGPRGWDALTHLCFSRYLRLDRSRSNAFVGTARAFLDAGANPNTGWVEMIDHPNSRPEFERAIYGAAALAQNADLTRLLLERGADPNDGETAYHVVETRDNTVLKILLESGKLNDGSLTTLLLRKCDWHDGEGLRMVLEHGANTNGMEIWGKSAIYQAVLRDNDLSMIEMLLDFGADPAIPNRDGKSAIVLAAHRGRARALELFKRHRGSLNLTGVDALIAACALDDKHARDSALTADPQLKPALISHGGTLLAQFSGVGNLKGVRNLLDLGVNVGAIYHEGDVYYGIARDSTALHVAAWRARTGVVKELIARRADVNATDGEGRTPLQLAVKACVDSHWRDLRSPDSIRALLDAAASTDGIVIPTGYEEIDELLKRR
jgi:ankyrin repeat protein